MRARLARGVVIALGFASLSLVTYARFAPLEPPESRGTVPGTVVLDARGNVLERDGRSGMRIPIGIGSVAPLMLQATISAEDRRFQQHPGVDPVAIARAALTSGSQPSGASTITQQLARRLYLADDASPLAARKAHEALVALQLEANRSKRQILELYLNDVYYGRGAYGIEAASRVYFGIGAGNLDLAHAAYLAGLPQRPSDYDPANDPNAARARQAYVLGRMVEDRWITKLEAAAAADETIDLVPAIVPPIAHQFVRFALAELARVRPDLAGRDGLVIETTLDAGLQHEAERLIRIRLDEFQGRNVTDAALVAIEPGTGRILSFVGSATNGDPLHGGEIDMVLTPRQPGSALKPFLYAAAFERGFTPATALLDVATSFPTEDGPYAPLDFDRSFHGVVPLRVALASSLNIPAVRTLDALGLDAMLEMTHRFGLGTLSEVESYGLGLTLGGGEVRLLDLANAYAALGAGGRLAQPFAVARVRDGAGRILYERSAAPAVRVLSTQHAYLLADILSDPDARIPGFGGVTPFELPFAAAVKSGTSTGFRDDWTLGYTPEIAVGVWVGNADGSPMLNVAGVDAAGPIWRDTMMAAALEHRMNAFVRPAGIVETTVCAPTGLLPGPDCPSPVRELFVAGTEPTAQERYYARDADGRITVDPPTEARDWARGAGLALKTGGLVPARDQLRVVAPVPGSTIYLAPELRAHELVLRAAAASGIDRVTFAIDGVAVGTAPAAAPWTVWALEVGLHTVRVSALLPDGSTASATAIFEVKR
ncbi:MAG TPA: transglycosylase domain-containing protein [Candidatus Limnocylindria bacterium]|jgi:penicillin-binding protein 1C|nr:transglycosylase domain-containing protein [Candidatus Limnocylindria bacterium]